MKSQLQNQESLSSLPLKPGQTEQPGQRPGTESSRIAAAISRILLVHRATSGTSAATSLASSGAAEPRRDATPVEWALRMMF